MVRIQAKTLLLLLLLCTVLLPQAALATRGSDKSMSESALDATEKCYDAFEATAKAWGKAAPGSPDAAALEAKGAADLAALEAEFNKHLAAFKVSEQWYKDQGPDYAEGRDFMYTRIKRLGRFMDKAKDFDLYKKLKP